MVVINLDPKNLAVLIIVGVISIYVAAALIPSLIEVIAGTNTTNWTKITGGAGLISLYGLLPFALVAGVLISIVFIYIKSGD
jgi:riboflavin transporter FmnP